MDEIDKKEIDLWLRRRLAENVRRMRMAKKLSQERLSELCGFHRTYVSQVERSVTNISVDNLQRIAEALEVDPSALLKARVVRTHQAESAPK
ncbi:XRE family transcriptional regulator [Burkholderia sp. Bp9143]|uniref:helix-turn-helix domain-containing protein n=1 Tax=Burkholderia sp. Bp9143 TaxID=2184574 RepID=UPI000F58FB93|nr:helix-turn-helix transcriptional regulator [Burkholderia sp. Bp9143]RQR27062.1 XRE family transcriptional regulator [Burkholderia sp. Bp9143]